MKNYKKLIIVGFSLLLGIFITGCDQVEEKLDVVGVLDRSSNITLNNAEFNGQINLVNESTDITLKTNGFFDYENNSAVINNRSDSEILSQDSTVYIKGDRIYIYNPLVNKWVYTVENDTEAYLNKGLTLKDESAGDLLILEEDSSNYIILSKEPIKYTDFVDLFNYNTSFLYQGQMIDEEILNNSLVEFTYKLDKDFYPVEIYTKLSFEISDEKFDTIVKMNFSSYNEQNEIMLPSEVKEASEGVF